MMVGVGTVLADDPQLTVRDPSGIVDGPQPLRVVVDSQGPNPRARQGFSTTRPRPGWPPLTRSGPGPDGRVDLLRGPATRCYQRGRRHVLLEGGPTLAAAFLDAGLVDEAIVYVAPTLLGAGRSALDGGAVGTLADAHRAELRRGRAGSVPTSASVMRSPIGSDPSAVRTGRQGILWS